ncbi:Bug family tripartite tricarboxylate transporter substrate binding protein [Ramlibacter sp.]|uniref:Bug family tripartite tricarboxylate transporter substrate binding protein n=1 Tax=Ramlibacter sp. TaxID=1917967 RepID=UPI003D13AE4F
MIRASRHRFYALAFALAGLFAGTAFAQANFPTKPVTLVVPVGTGGGTDLVARRLAKALSDKWGQPVVVENKPGASGIIGAMAVVKSPPDGYNLLLAYDGAVVAAPILVNRPDYDPATQLTAISQVSTQGYAVVVHPSVPAKNVAELIAHIKKKNAAKETFGFATSAPGAADHLSGEALKMQAGVDVLMVHYKGTAPAIADVVGGHAPYGHFSFTGALPHIKSGALRVLAVTSDKRSALLPDVPTVGETLKGYHYHSWIGVFGPAGMPAALRERISKDVHAAVNSPDMASTMLSNGLVPTVSDPAAFTEYVRQDAARTAEVIKRAQIKAAQ